MITKARIINYLTIIVGAFLVASSITIFFKPNQFVTGGVSGLAIIIAYYSDLLLGYEIPLWLTNIVLNTPLFLIALKLRGKTFIGKTLFATVALSVALFCTKGLPAYNGDPLLCAVYGGVMDGIGLGLVFRCFATTGGSDLAASAIHKFIPHVSVAKILMVIDSTIILTGMAVFGIEKTMYAIIAVVIMSRIIDMVITGLNHSKAMFIISDHTEPIAERVMTEIDRGATELQGRGMYTKKAKNVLLCVVSKREIVGLKDVIKEVDPNAFVIIADVHEVFGEGFGSIHKNTMS